MKKNKLYDNERFSSMLFRLKVHPKLVKTPSKILILLKEEIDKILNKRKGIK